MKKLMQRAHHAMRQGTGKVRRFVAHTLRKKHVAHCLEIRQGECARCGACCKLLFKCPFLDTMPDGSTSCRIHEKRPMNCRIFPLDMKDIAERGFFMDKPCGYHFPESSDPS